MFRNYLVTALRTIARHKLYSVINVAGLSVGLACAIFIVLFVRDELSYDKWIPESANLYRVEVTANLPGRAPIQNATSPFPLPRLMLEQIPEVKAMTRFVREGITVTVGDRQFTETAAVVDPNFFDVIKLPLAKGNPTGVLREPESIVMSQTMAKKYFGDTDPIGREVSVSVVRCDSGSAACSNESHPLRVTGVLRDLPHNTHLVADLVIPNTSQADSLPQSVKDHAWFSMIGYGYVALAPGADARTVLAKLRPILDKLVEAKDVGLNLRYSEFEVVNITPLWSVHLTSDSYNYGGMNPPGNWTTIYGLSTIAILIVLVACFNFMNLATARATLRAGEIALRKAVGARRRQLIIQFLGEALLTALISLVAALAIVEILLPLYDAFLERPITFHYLADWPLFAGIVLGAIVAGLLSGAYPALVLSRFRPAAILKTGAFTQSGSGLLRTTLVVSQFAVSIGLGIAAMVVFSQVRFARNVDLGFKRDGIMVIYGGNLTVSARESFGRALTANPNIAGVALSNMTFFGGGDDNNQVQLPGDPQTFVFRIMDVSPDFPTLYGMQLLAGRLLSTARGEDLFASYPFKSAPGANQDRNVLINASAAHRLGYSPEEAVGKTIVFAGSQVKIAGVMGDSKIDGVKTPVVPIVYFYRPDDNSAFSVRLRGDHLADTLSYVDRTWRSFAPGSPIQRYFLSESFDSQFRSDERQGEMFSIFVGIAIFIACLGLFGLAAFTAERRTKEIGVRKVFGARTADILKLLLWQFSVPVLIANLVAWPVVYYYLHHWLESYAYRISLSPLYFSTAAAVALGVAWVTIVGHALRVARANPIGALRYE